MEESEKGSFITVVGPWPNEMPYIFYPNDKCCTSGAWHPGPDVFHEFQSCKDGKLQLYTTSFCQKYHAEAPRYHLTSYVPNRSRKALEGTKLLSHGYSLARPKSATLGMKLLSGKMLCGLI